MTHPARPIWQVFQQATDLYETVVRERDAAIRDRNQWKASSKTWKADARTLLEAKIGWSQALRKMARRSVEHLEDYHAVYAVMINQLEDTRRLRKALRDLLDALNRERGEDLTPLMKVAEETLNGPPPTCPTCGEIEYGHVCYDTEASKFLGAIAASLDVEAGLTHVLARAEHHEELQEEAQQDAEAQAELDETFNGGPVNRAAAKLCQQYLSEFLHLPPGLPGIQFKELTEEGREVYRKLVRIVATELDADEHEKLREED